MCKSPRALKMLQNENLVAKFGFDTAESEPSEINKMLPLLINFVRFVGRQPRRAAWAISAEPSSARRAASSASRRCFACRFVKMMVKLGSFSTVSAPTFDVYKIIYLTSQKPGVL